MHSVTAACHDPSFRSRGNRAIDRNKLIVHSTAREKGNTPQPLSFSLPHFLRKCGSASSGNPFTQERRVASGKPTFSLRFSAALLNGADRTTVKAPPTPGESAGVRRHAVAAAVGHLLPHVF
ncbi:hypothetical protein MTO96_020387 [Rhipicephalus appendiculatus]